jgi:hypothetical protein
MHGFEIQQNKAFKKVIRRARRIARHGAAKLRAPAVDMWNSDLLFQSMEQNPMDFDYSQPQSCRFRCAVETIQLRSFEKEDLNSKEMTQAYFSGSHQHAKHDEPLYQSSCLERTGFHASRSQAVTTQITPTSHTLHITNTEDAPALPSIPYIRSQYLRWIAAPDTATAAILLAAAFAVASKRSL